MMRIVTWLAVFAGTVLLGGCAHDVDTGSFSSRRAVLGQPAAKSSAPTTSHTNAPSASSPR